MPGDLPVTGERIYKMDRDIFLEIHPGVQLLYFAFVILVSIMLPHPAVIGCSFLGALGYSLWLGGWKRVLRFQVFCMLPMTALVTVWNGAFSHYGVTPVYYLKTGAVTLEALAYGGVLAWMLWTSMAWFSAINQVMTMDRWVYLLGRCSPALSLALSITLRFIPRCRHQHEKMREGRRSLGMGEERRLRSRLRSGGKQLSMLLTWSLESGIEMADSMRARGYGSGRRTAYGKYSMEWRDWLALALMILLAACSLWGFILGYGSAYYNPAIRIAPLGGDAGSVVTYASWGLLCLLPVMMGCVQEIRRGRWERKYC